MTAGEALAFVERHGVVLQAARGPVPSLAEAVAGERISGSWWGHAKGRAIFAASNAVADSKDVLVCRLVQGKVTYVHRRLWPALVRLAARFPAESLAAVREEHTAAGHHRRLFTALVDWVTPDVARAAAGLSEPQAEAQLQAALGGALGPVSRIKPAARARARPGAVAAPPKRRPRSTPPRRAPRSRG
jgi:hypothetical protein